MNIYCTGLGFKPREPSAEDLSFSSTFSSFLIGDLLLNINSLISSPDKVSYKSSAFAILCKSSIFSVNIFFALSYPFSTNFLISESTFLAVSSQRIG